MNLSGTWTRVATSGFALIFVALLSPGCDSEFFEALSRWLGGECVPECATGYVCDEGFCVLPEGGELVCAPACTSGYLCRYGACVAEESTAGLQHTRGGQSWTVLVYLVGDNDLESFAVGDLEEMMQAGQGEGFRLVTQVDRAQGYSSADVGWLGDFTSTKRLVVTNGGLEEVADLGELNMADPATLADFIAWGVGEYPADQYALILWNHGAGWVGFGVDETTPGHPLLNLNQLKQGISQGLQRAGLSHFQLIGFDACLMANYAVAATLSPFGEYLLASEELEPGHGWDYRALSAVRDDPTMDATQLAAVVMDGYRSQAMNAGTDGAITLSLVDLTRMSELEGAVEAFAFDLIREADVTAAYVGRSRSEALRFGKAPDPAYESHLVDLGDFAKRVGDESGSFGASQSALSQAIERVVVSKVSGRTTGDATGLSIYFPPNAGYYNSTYDTFPEVESWRTFLRGYFYGGSQIERGVQFASAGGGADVSFSQGWLNVSAALSAGGSEVLVEAWAQFGLVLDGGAGTLLLSGAPADLSGDLVSQRWSGMTATLFQGDNGVYGYFDLRLEEGGTIAVVEIPFAYDTPSFDDPSYVVLQYVVDLDTEAALSAVYYEVTENSAGELSAQPGYVLLPIVPVGEATDPTRWEWMTLADEPFDASAEIEIYFDDLFGQLESGSTLHGQLTVGDYGGNGAAVWGQAVMP